MAAGGTFTVQNKVRPGVYFRFRSKNKQDLTVGDRGIAALCEPLHWGPTAKVIEIDAGADMTVYTGYDITAPENRFLTEIFKGTNRTAAPRKVLLYRPTASGAVKATMEIADRYRKVCGRTRERYLRRCDGAFLAGRQL